MAKIFLSGVIDVTMHQSGGLANVTSSVEPNNVSSDITETMSGTQFGSNVFILGASPLDSTAWYSEDEERYYIGSTVADENGNFEEPYVITITGNEVKTLSLTFDTFNNQHPKTLSVDGVNYAVESSTFSLKVEPRNEHVVEISNWNAPNYPLRLQGVDTEEDIYIDPTNLISLSRTITDRADYKLPSYGIISNSCEIEFRDLYGAILNKIEQNLIVQGLTLTLYMNCMKEDTTLQQQIGEYQAESWNYDEDSRMVNVTFKDNLEEWQNINVEAIEYNPNDTSEKTLQWFYEELHRLTPTKHNMKRFNELEPATQERLELIKIKYPLLYSGSLWQQWTKMCQVAQAHIFKSDDGRVDFVYRGGN